MSHRPPISLQRLFWSLHSINWDAAADRSTIDRALTWASEHVANRGDIIDLGCGTGNHAIALARAGHSVVGLDFAGGMLRHAVRKARRERLNASFRLADLNRSFPVSSGAFHGALSVSLLQCIADPSSFLLEVRRSLTVGGSFLVGVKTKPGQNAKSVGWLSPIKRKASRASFLHEFTSATLRQLLHDAMLAPVCQSEDDGWIWSIATKVSLGFGTRNLPRR